VFCDGCATDNHHQHRHHNQNDIDDNVDFAVEHLIIDDAHDYNQHFNDDDHKNIIHDNIIHDNIVHDNIIDVHDNIFDVHGDIV